MDPENTQTQVPPAPVSPIVTPVAPMTTVEPSVTPQVPDSVVQPQTPQVEMPKKGGSPVIKIAIWILVVAILVVIGYVVYVNYFAAPATVPLPTASASPVVSPTSSASAVPTATPVKTPSATP